MSKLAKGLLIAAGVLVTLAIIGVGVWAALGLRGDRYYWGWMGPGMMGGFGYGGGWLMLLGMVLFWGLVVWGIVALVRGTGRHHYIENTRGSESALDVLKRRYASGEINKDEYEQKKKDLLS